jgi:hypothetical protein
LNTQEAFWYLTGHAYWHQYAPPELYQPSAQWKETFSFLDRLLLRNAFLKSAEQRM